FLQWAAIMEILHQHQQSQAPKGSPKCGIWHVLVWRRFTGTKNTHNPPFMSIPGALASSIDVEWFNAHGKSTWLASIGPIMLICLNLPPSERLKPENVYVAGIIPGPKEPTDLQMNYLLMPLIKELKELWQGVPRKLGSPSHGNLKDSEWALLLEVYIPFLMLSQQMSLDEHKSANTQRNIGQSEELSNELTKNKFHLISDINISTSLTVSMDDSNAFSEHWKKFRLSNQQLFPKQKSKPNDRFADHILELFQRWGPAQASATWGYGRLIELFAKMPANNKICMSINKINIFILIKHMN
ncbi:hypothetical protein O181_107034, partial [Austropuccinia psidii MF-1]|nr:hypothetical protein [Austropuccinia psidii MF-1]